MPSNRSLTPEKRQKNNKLDTDNQNLTITIKIILTYGKGLLKREDH